MRGVEDPVGLWQRSGRMKFLRSALPLRHLRHAPHLTSSFVHQREFCRFTWYAGRDCIRYVDSMSTCYSLAESRLPVTECDYDPVRRPRRRFEHE